MKRTFKRLTRNSPYFKSLREDVEPATTRKVNRNVNREVNVCPTTESTSAAGVLPDRLGEEFFGSPCEPLARSLLGKRLVRLTEKGTRLSGTIVETECYLGASDKASHSYNGKRTPRNAAMFMKAGTAYVYRIYGVYDCFNISSLEEGAAVLLRALEPQEGMDEMRQNRCERRHDKGQGLTTKLLSNGPSKLCQAMQILHASFDQQDLTRNSPFLWLEDGAEIPDSDIVVSHRIGVTSAGEEWSNKPLRFYIRNNPFVSIRDKKAEASLCEMK